MPLRTDYVQTADFNNFIVFGIGNSLVFFVDFVVFAPCFKYRLVLGLLVACCPLYHIIVITFATHFALCEVFRVSSQKNIRAAARHVRCNCNIAELTCLRNNIRLFSVLLCVQNFVPDSAFCKQTAQVFGFFDRNGADKNRLPRCVRANDLFDNGVVFFLLFNADNVVIVHTLYGFVCRDFNNVKVVNAHKLRFFGLCRSRHAGKLVIHAEKVLIGYRCTRSVLVFNLNAFLCFKCLVQAVRIPPAYHKASREVINNNDLSVLNNIIFINGKQCVGSECLFDIVVYLRVLRRGNIVDVEINLSLAHTLFGKGDRARLYVAHIVAALLL